MNSTMGSTHERLTQLASCADLFARYTGEIASNGDSHELRAGFRLAF